MKNNHLQNKNAGNLGDYLKHFWLIRLIESLLKKYPNSNIAYVESHAGAGLYAPLNTHLEHSASYKLSICENQTQWNLFNKLNPFINHGLYFGSFALIGKLFSEHVRQKSKIILYEKDPDVFKRTKLFANSLLSNCELELHMEESNPTSIKEDIKKLQDSAFDIVVCFIDPYFKIGKEDKKWCEMLFWNKPNCFILVFDAATGRGKDEDDSIKFVWHCLKKEPIQYVNKGIKGYAMFGNALAENELKDNNFIEGKKGL